MPQLEIELRWTMDNQKYQDLNIYLQTNSHHFVKDNKISYFFVLESDHILKVVYEEGGSQFLVLKEWDEAKNILYEHKLPIQDTWTEMVEILKIIWFNKVNRVEQKRVNYYYKDTIISLKYTADRWNHFEIEYNWILNDHDQIISYLRIICAELDIEPMTPKEIREMIQSINTKHGLL